MRPERTSTTFAEIIAIPPALILRAEGVTIPCLPAAFGIAIA
jgi:hypothetical protein